ncbi:hepatic triacylglycerol lipase [Megalops cyprinoides]|uniref:hepatic triacylglycerol lipase n=1 Tax=Megalops cyprinoides TaxID=118141 RepID=UPI001864E2D9|nr:hepatic triacylglycerol lipase [Megalops cyprinoides]
MGVVRILACFLISYHLSNGQQIGGKEMGKLQPDASKASYIPKSVFRLYSEGASVEDSCTVLPYKPQTLDSCRFNTSNPLIIIIHGWSIDGTMENWVPDLAAALTSTLRDVNVAIVDWLSLAHHLYPTAVQNTRVVGQEVAQMLEWLEEFSQFPMDKVHLIGYCLGAHVSGLAGSYITGPRKIGRITGLDPTGPLFEGMSHTDRLSPDDAKFVDVIHTFTQQHMGLSMGIQQPVGHFDFYPNGGTFQPGCQLSNLFYHLSQYGLNGFQQSVKCSHERSVHLFIDSLLNRDKRSTAYWCKDESSFERGACLDCRKNRCNTLGYDVKRVRTGASKRLFLKTRHAQPYKVYHYQLKMQFINQAEHNEPSLTVSLTGTRGETEKLPITFTEGLSGNRTHSFLLSLDTDIGELMVLRLYWQGKAALANVWNKMQTIMPWGSERKRQELTLGRIRIKTGDTQKKTTFCAKTNDDTHIKPTQEKVFVRCEEGRQGPHRRRLHS